MGLAVVTRAQWPVTIGGTATPDTAPSCTGGVWSTQVDASTIGDGASVALSASFGTNAEEVTASATVLKDVVLPTVSITSSGGINEENQSAYSLAGTCSEDGGVVEVNIGGFETTANCVSSAWSITNYDLAPGGLSGSTIAIAADMTDPAGNPATQATASVGRDVDAPMVTITSTDRIINIADNNQFSLTGTCTVGDGDVSIQIGDLPAAITTTCDASGQWSLVNRDVTGLSEGVGMVLNVWQTDGASNRGEVVENTITKDIQAPIVTLTSSTQVNNDNADSFLLTGTCTDNRMSAITVGISGTISGTVSSISGPGIDVDCDNNIWELRTTPPS